MMRLWILSSNTVLCFNGHVQKHFLLTCISWVFMTFTFFCVSAYLLTNPSDLPDISIKRIIDNLKTSRIVSHSFIHHSG